MIRAFIVDDEQRCCQTLVTLLNRYCPMVEVAGIYYSGMTALPAIKTTPPQILFLDIEMPQMNGFELLQQLPEINFALIFTTSYDQYAIKAIRFSALDYLLKPIDHEELRKAVQKVAERLDHPLAQQIDILLKKLHQPAVAISKIALPTMEGLQMIPVDTVISCESDGNYTILLLRNKQKVVVSRMLKEMEEMLEEHSFLRVHHSFIVNLNEVEKYIKGEGGYLIMSDGSYIDVSRARKEKLLKTLLPGKE